jgi:glycosyltransferase involved in cell wall biosynthesis
MLSDGYSLVIPYYNKHDFIRRTLSSVYAQTKKFDEVIVVNDGSSNQSKNYIEALTREFRFKLINVPNAGVSSARNIGFLKADYRYVCFLDADDELLPAFLMHIAELVNESPECSLFGVGYKENEVKNCLKEFIYKGDYFSLYNELGKPPFCASSVCLDKKQVNFNEPFPVGFSMGEDIYAWARICTSYKFVFSSRALAIYHHDDLDSAVLSHAPKQCPPLFTIPLAVDQSESYKKFMSGQKVNFIKLQLLYGNKWFLLKYLSNNFEFSFMKYFVISLLPKKVILNCWILFKSWKKRFSNNINQTY